MPECGVPVRITVNVTLFVEAATAEEAERNVITNNWDDDTWAARCEIANIEVRGKVRER